MSEKEKNNYYKNSRPEIVSLIPGNIKSLLDVGCGEGFFLKEIKEQKKMNIWGVEIEPKVAEKAKNITPNIIVGKIEEVMNLLPNNYFDCITFNDVLEHLLEPSEVLRLINQKLTMDGIIIASIPNVRFIHNLFELLIKKDWEYKDSGILDNTHFRFFTEKSIKRMIENSGYKLIYLKGINKTSSWKFRLLNILSLGFLNDTGFMQFVCVIEK